MGVELDLVMRRAVPPFASVPELITCFSCWGWNAYTQVLASLHTCILEDNTLVLQGVVPSPAVKPLISTLIGQLFLGNVTCGRTLWVVMKVGRTFSEEHSRETEN